MIGGYGDDVTDRRFQCLECPFGTQVVQSVDPAVDELTDGAVLRRNFDAERRAQVKGVVQPHRRAWHWLRTQ